MRKLEKILIIQKWHSGLRCKVNISAQWLCTINSGVHNHHVEAWQEYKHGPGANCVPHLFMICDPLLIWMSNSWLRQISPHCARQRCIQTRPTTCQSLISSQNCNIRDVSLWLPRQGPIQFQFSQQIESLWVFVDADTDSDWSYLLDTVFFMRSPQQL